MAPESQILSARRLGRVLFAMLCLLALGPGSAQAGLRPLRLAFSDPLYTASDPAVRSTWLERSAALGAQVVRVDAGWPAATAPRHPADPADPAYDFSRLDVAVSDAIGHNLTPMLSFTGAPPWAEGPSRPANAPQGSWLPDPSALGAYGNALATRYGGRFPDPARPGAVLPRVALFQLWNEPNLSVYLSPQWIKRGGSWIAEAPAHYRLMLNAFDAGVKAASPGATVVAAGTAPYGDLGHGQRTMPLLFWRQLLAAPVSFDVMAHQPYSIGPPPTPALNADDVAVADMVKLTRLLRASEQRGTALPRAERHRVWVTETGYDTKPPNPHGVPIATAARYLEQSLFLFWREGVDLVTWFLIRDLPPGPTPGSNPETGVYYVGGSPKPAATAYRFPVVGHTAGTGVRAWLRAPRTGVLSVEVSAHGRWRTVRRARVRATQILDIALPGHPQALRASVAGVRSLVWTF